MSWSWPLVALAGTLALYFAAVLALLIVGQRENARALVGFVPDCVVLVSRLLRDPCVPRRRRLMLIALLAYLSSPIDLIPDFLPGVGHLDDAVVVALALRWIVRGCSPAAIEAHWPGPPASLDLVLKLIRPTHR
jgi:uncharacterized membrane protein YkvA (DUF1232 family)